MPDLATAVPLSNGLPRVLAEDDYARRFTSALDTVLAAAIGSYDNLTAYLDPGTAPADFLAWLGHWVAAPPDEMGEDERTVALRRLVPVAAANGARRGTAAALADELGRLCGVDVEVHDGGGVTWSGTAGSVAPRAGAGRGAVAGDVEVVVRGRCDRALVRRLVRRSTPAHLRAVVSFEDEHEDQDVENQHDQEET